MSADPVVAAAYDPQSCNPYSYVLNNPLRYVDPFGLTPQCLLFCTSSPDDIVVDVDEGTYYTEGESVNAKPMRCDAACELKGALDYLKYQGDQLVGALKYLEWQNAMAALFFIASQSIGTTREAEPRELGEPSPPPYENPMKAKLPADGGCMLCDFGETLVEKVGEPLKDAAGVALRVVNPFSVCYEMVVGTLVIGGMTLATSTTIIAFGAATSPAGVGVPIMGIGVLVAVAGGGATVAAGYARIRFVREEHIEMSIDEPQWYGFLAGFVLGLAGVIRMRFHLEGVNRAGGYSRWRWAKVDLVGVALIVASIWFAGWVWIDDLLFLTLFSLPFGLLLALTWTIAADAAIRARRSNLSPPRE
ncbi:MAG: hypothetical protein WEB52_00990 [Dehalococcoidia bacterium]